MTDKVYTQQELKEMADQLLAADDKKKAGKAAAQKAEEAKPAADKALEEKLAKCPAAALLAGLGWFDKLAKRAGVEMPITQAAYQVLYEGRDPKTVLQELMRREKRHEMEETWI